MKSKLYKTPCGTIQYWVSREIKDDDITLVFLPGLTADHRLFDKQVEYFDYNHNVFVWDAPGHASSYPFELSFSLHDKARWLDEILEAEGMRLPVIVGQSMGGYVAQAYMQLFPGKLKGFVSVDSDPLQRQYLTALDLWFLKRMEPFYRMLPWNMLCRYSSKRLATSQYGQRLMRNMMRCYDDDPARFAKLAGHGFKILAQAIEDDLPYEIDCPAVLVCGKKDRAGLCMKYNRAWHKKTGIPIEWIENAGHNSNTDAPEIVNIIIESLISKIKG